MLALLHRNALQRSYYYILHRDHIAQVQGAQVTFTRNSSLLCQKFGSNNTGLAHRALIKVARSSITIPQHHKYLLEEDMMITVIHFPLCRPTTSDSADLSFLLSWPLILQTTSFSSVGPSSSLRSRTSREPDSSSLLYDPRNQTPPPDSADHTFFWSSGPLPNSAGSSFIPLSSTLSIPTLQTLQTPTPTL